MILRDVDLIPRLVADPPLLDPHYAYKMTTNGMSYGLSCAGYDIRVAINPMGDDKVAMGIRPHEFMLVSTLEKFNMPDDLLGEVKDKSTWARRGLAVQNTVIEPGWCGYLTLELSNHGDSSVWIKGGDPIAQILFHQLAGPVENPYTGKYQNQEDRPVRAREEMPNPVGKMPPAPERVMF